MAQSARLASLVVVVISPQPLTSSSVVTSTNRNSPQYDPLDLTSHGLTPVIFIEYCPSWIDPTGGFALKSVVPATVGYGSSRRLSDIANG